MFTTLPATPTTPAPRHHRPEGIVRPTGLAAEGPALPARNNLNHRPGRGEGAGGRACPPSANAPVSPSEGWSTTRWSQISLTERVLDFACFVLRQLRGVRTTLLRVVQKCEPHVCPAQEASSVSFYLAQVRAPQISAQVGLGYPAAKRRTHSHSFTVNLFGGYRRGVEVIGLAFVDCSTRNSTPPP
jgi:hypothetical protein